MVDFVVNGKAFVEASSRVGKIVKSDNLDIIVKKGLLLLHMAGDMQEATCIVPCKTKKTGRLTITKTTIDAILKGRDDIELRVKNNMLSFASLNTGYKGDNLPVLPPNETEVEEPSFKKSSWSADLQTKILKALEACSITSFYEEDQLPILLEKRKDQLLVACADQFHVALCRIKVKSDMDFKSLVIPSSYSSIICGFAEEPFRLSITPSALKITTETFSCSLPSLQVAATVTMDQVVQLVTMGSKASFTCRVKSEAMAASLGNLQVVYEVGAGTNLSYKDKKLVLGLNTTYGTTEDKLVVSDTKGKGTISLNSENLDDLLGRMQGEVLMRWFDFGAQFSKELSKDSSVDYFVASYTDLASDRIKSKASVGNDDEE